MSREETKLKERLYGREEEVHRLHAAYHRRISSYAEQESELVLITGRSGTGKSTLARTLKNTVVSDGGFFVSGKFDQMQRPEPYAAFVVAFSKLSELIAAKDGEPKAEAITERIRDIPAVDAELLLDTVPSLEKLLDIAHKNETNDSIHNINETDARKRRFLASFRGIIRAIASPECPLVLFLDDIQWADKGSLDLLATLAEDSGENNGFMLLGACRGNEVSVDDYLSVTLRALEDKQVKITDIHISNFTRKDVQTIVHTWFPTSEDFETLVELLYDRTDGNIFFLLQLAKRLQDEGILATEDPGKEWHLDQDRISAIVATRNVVGMMEKALDRLPGYVKEVLQIASCLGATFRIRHLDIVLPDLDVPVALKVAADAGLVHVKVGGGKFSHDRMQEATYLSIPPDKRPYIHATIGRKLLECLSSQEIDSDIFLIVNQVGLGSACIEKSKEGSRLAELCLQAGKKAVSSSAFGAAGEYLDLGIEFLEEKHWREEYELSLALFNAAAEVEYCNANFSKTDSLLDEVFRNARCFDDKIQSYNTRVFALGAQARFSEAIATALKVLRKLGEKFPTRPNKLHVVMEVLKTKWMLRRKTVQDIASLPTMTNPKKLAAIQMMNLVYLYTFFTRQDFVPLLAARIVQRSLQYGLSGAGSVGFGVWAMLVTGNLGQLDDGYKYAQVSLRVLERFDSRTWKARVYVAVYGMVIPWVEPVQNTLVPLQDAHRVGTETGDIEFAMMAITLRTFHAFFTAERIPKLVNDMVAIVDKMRAFRQEAVVSLILPLLQLCSNFMGEAENPFVLTGRYMNETDYILAQEEAHHNANILHVHLIHSELYYYMNDYDRAAEASRSMSKDTLSSIGVLVQVMFDGLIAAEMARRTKERHYFRTARQSRKKLKKWANYSPCSFLPFCRLVEAEVAALENDVDGALFKYKNAFDLAKREGFLHIQALACERTALTLCYFKMEHDVKEYQTKARDAYEEWGFSLKVDQLNKLLSCSEQPVQNRV